MPYSGHSSPSFGSNMYAHSQTCMIRSILAWYLNRTTNSPHSSKSHFSKVDYITSHSSQHFLPSVLFQQSRYSSTLFSKSFASFPHGTCLLLLFNFLSLTRSFKYQLASISTLSHYLKKLLNTVYHLPSLYPIR